MSPELQELLEKVKDRKWTPEERREHIISFAYANVKLHNPRITREEVERAYDEVCG